MSVRTDDFNSFGNFVNRALKFVASQYESTIPDSGDEPGPYSPNDENDADFITEINGLVKEYVDNMDAVKLRSGLQTVMAISARGNLYLQSSGLNKQLMTDQVRHIINHAEIEVIVCDPRLAGLLGRALEGCRTMRTVVFTGLDQIRGMEFGGPENEFLIASGVAGSAGTIVLQRTDGGRNLKLLTRNEQIPTRTSFVWLN